MVQTDSFSAPDPVELAAEAAELARDANFSRAAGAFCDGLVGYAAQVRRLNVGAADTLRWALATLTIALDDAAPGGATAARLARLAAAGGLGGPAAVRGGLQALAAGGLVTLEPDPQDRRARRVRPTALLLGVMQAGLAVRLGALEQVRPLPAPAGVWAARPGVLPQFLARNARAFVGGFRLTDSFPEVRALMDRHGGYLILLQLIARAEPHGGAVRSQVSPSRAAGEAGVSRAQVRKVLALAAAAGWLAPVGSGGEVRMSAQALARLRQWIAHEFAWTWRLVGEASPAYGRAAP